MRTNSRGFKNALLAGAMLLGCAHAVCGQEKPEPAKPAYVFPETVKFEFKAKKGDHYKFISSKSSTGEMKITGIEDASKGEEDPPLLKFDMSVAKTFTYDILNPNLEGNIQFEVKLIDGVDVSDFSGASVRTSLISGTMTALLQPSLKQIKLTFPAEKPESDKPKSTDIKSATTPEAEKKSSLSELLPSEIYPENPHNAGDTWLYQHKTPTTPEDKEDCDLIGDIKGTAKLVGFVLFGDTPCAKMEIEYLPDGSGKNFLKFFTKLIPSEGKVEGKIIASGKSTYLISLDRNAILDTRHKFSFDVNLTVAAGTKKVMCAGQFNVEGHETAVKFPAFDSNFKSSPAGSGFRVGE